MTACFLSKSATAAGKRPAQGKGAGKVPRTGAESGVGHDAWLKVNPSTGVNIGEASAGGSVHLGVELLNTVAACRATVPDNKGFEDTAFNGYSDRSWSYVAAPHPRPLRGEAEAKPTLPGGLRGLSGRRELCRYPQVCRHSEDPVLCYPEEQNPRWCSPPFVLAPFVLASFWFLGEGGAATQRFQLDFM